MEQQPITSDDVERLVEGATASVLVAMSVAMLIQYVLLGLILWRVW
jgi:ABC-type uncharacterized transport system YnjBCD permease subunit